MKIKMLTSIAGADFALSSGDETERFSKDEAARMIEAGVAVPVVTDKVERTVKKRPADEAR